MERNKVMSFGEPSPDPVETADRFMVGGGHYGPPMEHRVNTNTKTKVGYDIELRLFSPCD